MSETEALNILDLPNLVLLEIFEYLSYDEVSKKRLVTFMMFYKYKLKFPVDVNKDTNACTSYGLRLVPHFRYVDGLINYPNKS